MGSSFFKTAATPKAPITSGLGAQMRNIASSGYMARAAAAGNMKDIAAAQSLYQKHVGKTPTKTAATAAKGPKGI